MSCMHVLHGQNLVEATVATQTVPALSSGEAEFVARVRSGSVGLGGKSLAAGVLKQENGGREARECKTP